jgi:hypothetical protein
MKYILKFALSTLSYAVLFYLFCSYLANDIDYRWWWDWQQAIFWTGTIVSGAFLGSMIREEYLKNKI